MKTIADAKAQIIQTMQEGKRCIERLKRTGEYEKYANLEYNPEGLPEANLGITATARDWLAVRDLEAEGVIVVARRNLADAMRNTTPFAYLIAGPNFPKEV